MKRFLVILLVLIGLLAGGAYFLYLKAITPGDIPVKVLKAEEVIATSGTIAIASIDMSHARRIDKMFKDMTDPAPLAVPKPAAPNQGKPKPTQSILERLKKQGINLISETDYALATINVGKEKPAYTFVLFGRYSKNKLKQALQKTHLVEENADGYLLITQVVEEKISTDPCVVPTTKKPELKQQALHIQKDRILLSSPELMPVLLSRFANNGRAGISLTKWHNFRKDKVVAGAFISPKEAKKGAVDLPSAILLGAVSSQPLTEVYAGAIVSVIPSPGFTLLIDAHSNDAAWPQDVKTKYDAWLLETISDIKEMPTLASLFKTLNVQADGNVLRFKTLADRTTLDNIEKLPEEFFKMIFSSISFGDDKADFGTEKIVKVEDLKKYEETFDFSSLQDFDAKSTFYKSEYVAGPFGIRLKKINLLEMDDSVIELNIHAEGKGFENLSDNLMHKSDDSSSARMYVTHVEDKKGNNLLREEQCGKTRNSIATPLNSSRDKEHVDGKWISKSLKVSGVKSIRLKENTPLSKIEKINGKVVVRAATRTRIQEVKRPFKKKTIETDKVRMFLKKSSGNNVKYDLSGEMNRILEIRAKNAKGEYLADSSSSSSGKDVKTISKRFRGKVASIEVVIADEMVSKEYPFELNKAELLYGPAGKGAQVSMMTTSKKAFLRKYKKLKYKDECKDKQKVELGGLLICLNKFGDRWGKEIGAEFDVVAPADEALQNDLTAGVVSIDSVQTEDGKQIVLNKKERVGFEYKFDTVFNKKTKDWEILNKRLYGTNVAVYSDKEELKNKKISSINGTLTIRIPKKPKHFDLPANELGIIKNKDGIIAKVSAFEDWNTYVDLQGKVDNVMRFMALSQDRAILKTGNDRIDEKEYSTWGKSEEEKEKIKTLPKKWQGMITIYGKPEVIRVYYAEEFDVIKRKFKFSIK